MAKKIPLPSFSGSLNQEREGRFLTLFLVTQLCSVIILFKKQVRPVVTLVTLNVPTRIGAFVPIAFSLAPGFSPVHLA